MSEKNPFAALGFAPGAFAGLSSEQIRSLVKAQYLALAAIHHPDRGGNSQRFMAVQEAATKLEQDHEFGFWLNAFLRPRKDRLAELEKACSQTRAEALTLRQQLVAYWVAFCRGAQTFAFPELGLSSAVTADHAVKGFSVFKPPPVSLLVQDVKSRLMRTQASVTRKEAGDRDITAYPQNELLELKVTPDGGIFSQELVKQLFDPRETWRPQVRPGLIFLRDGSQISKSYYWQAQGKPSQLAGVLLGSLPSKLAQCDTERRTRQEVRLITTEIDSSDYRKLEQGYSLDEFEPFFPYLSPAVMSGTLLVLAEGNDDHNLRFKVLGTVLKILPLLEDRP